MILKACNNGFAALLHIKLHIFVLCPDHNTAVVTTCLFVFVIMSDNVPVENYRKVLKEVFLAKKLSALDTQRLASSSTAAGASGVSDFSRAGASGKHQQNMHRDITRSIMRECTWPSYYYADVPVLDSNGNMEVVSMRFLLPHEVPWQLSIHGKLSKAVTTRENSPPGVWLHCKQMGRVLGKAAKDITAVGFHGDGAPCGAHDSIEQLSWNLPAWQGSGYSPRFLICSVMKQYVCKKNISGNV